MNPQLIAARDEFWRAYAAVKKSVATLSPRELVDLQHESEDAMRKMSSPFSEQAAAQMVYAACTEALG